MKDSPYIVKIEHVVAGIKAIIGVRSFNIQPAWAGPESECPSDMDKTGYVEAEWDLLDHNGNLSAWLNQSRTREIDEEIEQVILQELTMGGRE